LIPRYADFMRCAQGGGLTAERRVFCETLRLEAAERFAWGVENTVIAHNLRVGVRSVQPRRKAWSQGGTRGPGFERVGVVATAQ
jgi:hypothetical protein